MEKELHDTPSPEIPRDGAAPPYTINRMGEAADMYGDIQTAEEYGYVTRGYVVGILQTTRFNETNTV